MSTTEIERKATEWLNSDEFYKRGSIIETAYVAYVAGAKMANDLQARFDELDQTQKSEFMKNNIAWATGRVLQDEIDLRNDYDRLMEATKEDEERETEK